jgi:hypothetical protein
MFIIYRIIFFKFFKSEKGISEFAERCINKYVKRCPRFKVASLVKYVEVLENEKERKKIEFKKIENVDRMDDGAFALQRKKTKRLTRVVWITVLFEIFLNYISTLIFIQGEGLLYLLVRWGLAIILTLAAMLVTDGLLTKILPEEPVRVRGNNNQNTDIYEEENSRIKKLVGLILLPVLLILVEIAIIGVAHARALDIEGGVPGGILYYGFILLSMALPIIAGYFKWESEHNGRLYQNTILYYQNFNEFNILKGIIIANIRDLKNVIERSINKAWTVSYRFRRYKLIYNKKRDIIEDISEIETFKKFREKALNDFEEKIIKIINIQIPEQKQN